MSTEDTESKPRTYGNWMKPEEKGILPGLGPLGTGIIFMACIVLVLLVTKSEWIAAGCVTLVGVLLLWLVTHRDQHGKSAADRIIVRIGWWRSRRKKENVWRAGTLGYGRPGSVMLPGILGQVELVEGTDATGVPFGVLFCPRQDTYTVVVNSSPSGEDLVDRDQIDRWVAMWGVFKADMADEQGLQHFGVTIETRPENPLQLKQEVDRLRGPREEEDEFSMSVLQEIVRTYPRGSTDVQAYLFFTFSADRGKRKGVMTKKRRLQEFLQEFGPRLPYLVQKVQETGAGACHPMSAQELCRYVRIAYDSQAKDLFEEADALGQDVTMDWSQCGPMAAEASWDSYRHDGDVSVTWELTQAPRGAVQSSILRRFLSPQANLSSKRVTWLFRPVPPERTGDLVDSDVITAQYQMTLKNGKPTARASRRLRAATQTAEEEANGAGLENFSAFCTATIAKDADLHDATAAVESLAATARLRLRRVYGSQDSAFAACLPLGLDTRKYTVIPAEVSEKL